MTARRFKAALASIVSSLAMLACGHASAADPPPRPNIVVILSDDMGYSDIGCYGSEIETPNLDRLAKGGLRFTQFYNTARCCPTRASLLTGLYPHQAGIGHMTNDRHLPGYRGDLNDRCVTIAEALKPAGYASYAVGKWHVTKATNPASDDEKHNWPLQRGFSRFYGTITGAGNFFDPATLVRDNRLISAFADPEYPAEDYYYTDAISDHAARFIREHDRTKPFFLYVAYTAAHWPMHARDRDIKKYEGRYAAGYEAIRGTRYAKMLTEGVVTKANTTLWPFPEDLGERGEFWPWDRRNMEVFAAMVDSMDQGIGRIVKAIQETGKADNTLVCYLQDNGGCAEGMGRDGVGGPRADAPSLPPIPNDDIRSSLRAKQTRDGYPVRQGKGVMAGPADTFIGYGEAWSTVSNTPFRRHKHWVHEGGISTPLVVHWPRGISKRDGLEHTPGHLIDIMATAVDLAGASYPADRTPLEGRSLVPLFAGGSLDRDALYWEHEGNRAVRQGDWKLVAVHKGPWELYDLSKDRSEQHDLSGSDPERVKRMAAMWDAYAARANVAPWIEVTRTDAGPNRGTSRQKKPQASPPNIVFLLVDDLGSADCGFAGGTEIKTPRIDALAHGGTILDALYVQPVCSPTRACLMTGRYPTRTGVYGVVRPHAPWGLPLGERTLADAVRAAGYQTAISGKWHLGEFDRAYVPTARGFDRQYGHYFGMIDYFTHVRDGTRDWYRDDEPVQEEGYATELIAAEACRMISSRDPSKPLFLYVPFNGVHSPFQVPDRYTAPYEAVEPRNRRMLAGMLAAVDEGVGRIVDALDRAGIRDDTLIVFCGDNGGPKPGTNGRLRGFKGSLYEGGIRTSGFVNWPGHVPAGRRVAEPLHTVDWFPTLVKIAGGAHDDRPIDGRDAWGVITAGEKSPHETILVADAPDRAALRLGDWKLIVGAGGRGELYDLATDPGERIDRSAEEPDRMKTMRAILAEAIAGAVPSGGRNPAGEPPRRKRPRKAS